MKDRKERLVVIITEDLKRELREIAWRQRMSLSELVRATLKDLVEADSEPKPWK